MNKNLLIFIGIAVVILGIVYFMSLSQREPIDTFPAASNDASVSAIERELDETDLENLDGEFAEIDAELEAAISESQ